MIGRLVSALREAPEAPRLEDKQAIDDLYRSRRNQVLYGSMVAYALFYFCRQNISVAFKGLAKAGYDNTRLGDLNSTLYITYGVSKFLSGLVADRAHPRAFMIMGLLLSALANVWFGVSSEIQLLLFIWALNGVFQSTGAPASAKIMASWFSVNERGTKTGIWNASHQVGGGLALVIAGLFAAAYGWRGAMIGPAAIALVGALIVARFIHDRPESEGLPPIEEHRNDPVRAEEEARGVPFGKLLVESVLLNPRVWIVALGSLCVYVVRKGTLDWMAKYLGDVRGWEIAQAASVSSILEFSGIPGAFFCGWLSDRVFATRRAPVCLLSLVLLAGSTWLLFRVPPGHGWLDAVLIAAVGFFTYGPQLLLAGVSPVDLSSRRVAAAAVGFTGLMSYAGATISSSLTGRIIDARLPWGAGWGGAFDFWAVASLVGALVCVPLLRSAAGKGRAGA